MEVARTFVFWPFEAKFGPKQGLMAAGLLGLLTISGQNIFYIIYMSGVIIATAIVIFILIMAYVLYSGLTAQNMAPIKIQLPGGVPITNSETPGAPSVAVSDSNRSSSDDDGFSPSIGPNSTPVAQTRIGAPTIVQKQ